MKLLVFAVFFSCLFNTYISPIKYQQTITVTFPGELPMILVDNKRLLCHCGKTPVEINVLNGIVSAHCEKHRLGKSKR